LTYSFDQRTVPEAGSVWRAAAPTVALTVTIGGF
jgi:hypothetical protein